MVSRLERFQCIKSSQRVTFLLQVCNITLRNKMKWVQVLWENRMILTALCIMESTPLLWMVSFNFRFSIEYTNYSNLEILFYIIALLWSVKYLLKCLESWIFYIFKHWLFKHKCKSRYLACPTKLLWQRV